MTITRRLGVCLLTATTILVEVTPAAAQEESPKSQAELARSPGSPSSSIWDDLFAGTAGDVKRLPSRFTAEWLALGALTAAGTYRADKEILRTLSRSEPLEDTFTPGATIGQTTLQLGAALATYMYGRNTHHPRVMAVGADLFRAQVLAEGLTLGMKHSFRRTRPEGSGFAFPSGHTTVTFASATVLQRHFGWKAGIPAYLVAAYVGVSRVQMKRHNLSDVAMGAALGIVAGHSVTLGRAKRLELSPMAAPGGGGFAFTWKGRQ